MRTRSGFWILLIGLGPWACNSRPPPSRPGAPARPTPASGPSAPVIVPGVVPDAGVHPHPCAAAGTERTPELCSNHIDDDCDGWSDCDDLDCAQAGVSCHDAAVRLPTQTVCEMRGPENTATACADHLDDDCDGQIDCADNDCLEGAPTVCPRRAPVAAPAARAPVAAPAARAPVAAPAARPAVPAAPIRR